MIFTDIVVGCAIQRCSWHLQKLRQLRQLVSHHRLSVLSFLVDHELISVRAFVALSGHAVLMLIIHYFYYSKILLI